MHFHHRERSVFSLEKPKPTWQQQGVNVIVVMLLCGLCWQGYHWAAGGQNASSEASLQGTGTYQSTDGKFLGRNFKIRMLEQQLLDKENEIRFLQYQISKATLNTKLKDSTMQAADAMIKTLQEREERERSARSKAQRVLAEKVTELNACATRRQELDEQLETCGEQLDNLTVMMQGPGAVVQRPRSQRQQQQQSASGGADVVSPAERRIREGLPEHVTGRRVAH